MVRVFCDFDGTAAAEDIGSRLFARYAGTRAIEIVQGYLGGSITARQCLLQECAAVDSLAPDELEQFVGQFSLDPHFTTFVEFCELREIPVVILSDGLDFYVERVLRRHGLGRLPFFANHVEFESEVGRTRLVPSFPYTDSECELCANCKRNHILSLSADEDVIVYIGDGISDRCPIRYADIVFAKKGLVAYCQELNITYHGFEHFGDVRERFELILRRKRIKQRREAMMARREVFTQG